jgi:YidC/Oxa1 family membrane protein insertase
LFYKLSEAQYRSMAKTRKFAPRLQELRERFADNREALNKAMMDLYKKEGFNPLAGCWPILVQFPVFLSLYSVIGGSVELRQSGFLWLQDLTAPDPYFILPVLYGAAMWWQQRMSGQSATMDPAQARIMGVMPIAMTGMFAFFPGGLVLYWFVNTAIGIAQQWLINYRLDKEGLGRKSAA